MHLHQIADEYNISLAKLRKLQAAGLLRVDLADNPVLSDMRYFLGRSQPLTAYHLSQCILDPDLVKGCGTRQAEAQRQITALGHVVPMPRKIAAVLNDALAGNLQAQETFEAWVKSVLPVESVSHYWLAVRVILGFPEAMQLKAARAMPRYLQMLRRSPSFSGCFTPIQGPKGRTTISYHAERL